MWFLVKIIRPIYAYPLGLIFALIALIRVVSDIDLLRQYQDNVRAWEEIKTLEDLQNYFKTRYKYKSDGLGGLLDHHNFSIEFFSGGGDCDDMAFYAFKKLKDITLKSKIFTGYMASIYWMYGNGVTQWHFDCKYTSMENFNDSFWFNYGLCTKETIMDKNDEYKKLYGWKNTIKFVRIK